MKNLNKDHKIVIFLAFAVIILAIVYLLLSSNNTYGKIFSRSKPSIKIGVMGFENPEDASKFFVVSDYLNKRFNIEYVEDGYSILLAGPGAQIKDLPQDSSIIKIHQNSALRAGNMNKMVEVYDLVFGLDYIEYPNYFRIPPSYLALGDKISRSYKSKMRGKCEPSAKKHFACFLSDGGGKTRNTPTGVRESVRLFHRTSLYKSVPSGGNYLNNTGIQLKDDQSTLDWLSSCKFAIVYEDEYYPGYITKKAYQAYFAGTIPIYKSHATVLNELNKDALILGNNFKTHKELLDYVKELDKDDKKYCEIWNKPIMPKGMKGYDEIRKEIEKHLDKILKSKLK